MSLTNSQMIAGRFLRYARARQRVAWIKAQTGGGSHRSVNDVRKSDQL
jgi:hypothetical protein